jgi:hypothetical protein
MTVKDYEFTVVITTDTPAHAREALAARIADAEVVGFDYSIRAKPLAHLPYWFTVRADMLGKTDYFRLPGEWGSFLDYVGDPDEDVEELAERLDDLDYNESIYTEEGTQYMKRYTKIQSGTAP